MGKLRDTCCGPKPMTDAQYRKQEERWRAEADLETILSAQRIKKDKGRLNRAIAIAKEKKTELAAVSVKEVKS